MDAHDEVSSSSGSLQLFCESDSSDEGGFIKLFRFEPVVGRRRCMQDSDSDSSDRHSSEMQSGLAEMEDGPPAETRLENKDF